MERLLRAVKRARPLAPGPREEGDDAAVVGRVGPAGVVDHRLKGPVLRGGGVPRNADTLLTYADPRRVALYPTRDPFDRAHGQVDQSERIAGLLPACRSVRGRPIGVPIPGSVARRYPACALTMAGVSHDTAAERLGDMQAGLLGIPGIGRRAALADGPGELSPVAAAQAAAMARIAAKIGDQRMRDLVRRGDPKVWRDRGATPEETRLHDEGTRILRAAGL